MAKHSKMSHRFFVLGENGWNHRNQCTSKQKVWRKSAFALEIYSVPKFIDVKPVHHFFFLRVCHLFFVPWTFPLPFALIWCDTSSIAIWFCHFGVFFFFFFMHMFSTSNLIIYKKPGNERAPNTTNRKCFCVEIARTPTHPHQSRAEKFLSHYFVFLVHFFLDASMRTSKSERRRGRGRVFECDYHWEAASIEHALHFKWKRPTCHSQS